MAQHFGRFGDRAHGVDHAQHGGDDAERRHAVGDVGDGVGDLRRLVVMGLDFLVDDRFHFMGVVGAQRQQAQIVAQEVAGMVVGVEGREFLEEGAFVGLFDMAFQRQIALGLGQPEQRIV